MKANRHFKKGSLLVTLIGFSLLISFGISHGYHLQVLFDNRISQHSGKRAYFFILDITPELLGELDEVDYVTAVNTDPDLFKDRETYYFEIIFLGNNILEIISQNDYHRQGGVYAVTVHFEDGSSDTRFADYIVPRKKPVPSPEDLMVDFSTGYITPTLSCSSVDDETVDIYTFELYFGSDRKRLLAKVDIWDPDTETFQYYEGAPGGTGERLQAGEVYLFRAAALDINTGPGGGITRNIYRGFNYLAFIVPTPGVHYTCGWLSLSIGDSSLPEGVKQSLLAKLETCEESNLSDFIEQVRALRGKKIPRWYADILIQCAQGAIGEL